MNARKMELFLIISLICVNLFFVFVYIDYERTYNRIPTQTVKNACEVLSRRGIYVSEDEVYTSLETHGIFEYKQSDDLERNVAESFSEGELSSFALPDGMVYFSNEVYIEVRRGMRLVYRRLSAFPLPSSEAGTGDKEESDALKAVEENTERINNGKIKLSAHKDSEIYEEKIITLANKKLPNSFSRATLSFNGYVEIGGFIYCGASQRIGDISVSGNTLVFVFSDDGRIAYINGSYNFSASSGQFSKPLIDGTNILFYLPDNCGTLKAMRLVYIPVFYSKTSFYMIPTYEISFSDGKTLLLDAVSGYNRSAA